MNNEINYKNNPLNGVGLKVLLTEIIDHYGFEILFAYLNINCFKTNPSIESSIKFLKKTSWAREKVEAFYMYQYKSLPRASSEQFELSPRDRIVPNDQSPGDPVELSLEDADRLREKRANKWASKDLDSEHHSVSSKNFGTKNNRHFNKRDNNRSHSGDFESSNSEGVSVGSDTDPWGKWKK